MKEMIYKTLILDDRYKYILEGLLNTVVMAFFAVIIGIILGLIVSIIRNEPISPINSTDFGGEIYSFN